ncbi:MAG: DUF1501 domain-containing protein [Planctomycetales bacterium]|nr:DUF1501 domain-containing protein [Planctomycetales bacterium]
MLRLLGRSVAVCDGQTRREVLRVGGLSLFSGLTLPRYLAASDARRTASAKSVILINLFGGPPHQDMFDMKPNAPENVRGEFKPIATSVPGTQICELLPQTALLMDRATLIRTYSHKYNSHNPYNVLTGFDGGKDAENYFAKRTDHPSMGSICQSLNVGPDDVPRYVLMPAFPGYTQALRRSGPYGGYLGSQYDPLFTVCEPRYERESKGDYDSVTPLGAPVPPSLGELPGLTADRLEHRFTLLEQLDRDLANQERSGAVARMDHFKRRAFSLLASSKTRHAFDVSRESEATRADYGPSLWGSSVLIARRLVEAGSTFVTVNWEAKRGNHWDLHENNFGMLRAQLPVLDQLTQALIRDLEQRGLLDQTLVVIMGEMGRTPRVNGKAGRDHWPQCGFALLFGGGVKRGVVVGRTDSLAALPADRPVSAGDMVATIYQLLGVDPTLTVPDIDGRPVHICHGGSPVKEAIA